MLSYSDSGLSGHELEAGLCTHGDDHVRQLIA